MLFVWYLVIEMFLLQAWVVNFLNIIPGLQKAFSMHFGKDGKLWAAVCTAEQAEAPCEMAEAALAPSIHLPNSWRM